MSSLVVLSVIALWVVAGIAILLLLDDRDHSFYEWVANAPQLINMFAAILVPFFWPIFTVLLYRRNFSGFTRR